MLGTAGQGEKLHLPPKMDTVIRICRIGRIDFFVKRLNILWITSTCGVQVGLKYLFKDETVQIGMSGVSGACVIYF